MFTLALAAAALAVTPTAIEPPADPTQAFLDWAGAQGTPVSYAVCFAQPEQPITCYGLLGDETDGWEGVLVGFAPNLIGADGQPLAVTEFLQVSFTPSTGAAPSAEPAAGSAAESFGAGTKIVGTDIQPGTYVATVPGDSFNCYWERLAGFSGGLSDIIANDNSSPGEQVIVEISASDAGFSSSGCGTWEQIG